MSVPVNPIGPSNYIAIQSVTFSNTQRSVFLRIDGSNVTQFEARGSGTVNCQFYAPGTVPFPGSGNLEALELISIPSVGSVIRSAAFPNVFLRLDASGVTASQGVGVGTVNCQYYPEGTYPNSQSDWEVFEHIILESTPGREDVGSLKSSAFPQVFLRMDGSNVTQFEVGGSGTVNGQFYPSSGEPKSPNDYETLKIIHLFVPL
jgi:hypothetical protein